MPKTNNDDCISRLFLDVACVCVALTELEIIKLFFWFFARLVYTDYCPAIEDQ